jgi:hypothetical protein
MWQPWAHIDLYSPISANVIHVLLVRAHSFVLPLYGPLLSLVTIRRANLFKPKGKLNTTIAIRGALSCPSLCSQICTKV